MAVSNCNKEVATRLYRMLAISELEADRVKSDHASFAKLGLLTQQAQLLQRQAVQVVNKSVLKAEKDELAGLSTMSTALTTDDSAGAKRVLAVLAVNEKTQATIERDLAVADRFRSRELQALLKEYPAITEAVPLPAPDLGPAGPRPEAG